MTKILKKIIPLIALGLFIFPNFSHAALTDGLVSYYKLESNSNDSTSTNNGTDTNIVYGTGKIGNGAVLYTGGTYSKIALGDVPFNFTGDYSISFWYYLPSGYNDAGYIVSRTTGSSPYVSYNIYPSSATPGFVFQMNNTAATPKNATKTVTLTTNQWYHLVATINGTSMLLYVNGSAGSTTTFSGSRISNSIQTTVGARGTDNVGPANGTVDELAFYARTLSAAEVTQLYNGGNGLQYPFTGGLTSIKFLRLSPWSSVKFFNGIPTANIKSYRGNL